MKEPSQPFAVSVHARGGGVPGSLCGPPRLSLPLFSCRLSDVLFPSPSDPRHPLVKEAPVPQPRRAYPVSMGLWTGKVATSSVGTNDFKSIGLTGQGVSQVQALQQYAAMFQRCVIANAAVFSRVAESSSYRFVPVDVLSTKTRSRLETEPVGKGPRGDASEIVFELVGEVRVCYVCVSEGRVQGRGGGDGRRFGVGDLAFRFGRQILRTKSKGFLLCPPIPLCFACSMSPSLFLASAKFHRAKLTRHQSPPPPPVYGCVGMGGLHCACRGAGAGAGVGFGARGGAGAGLGVGWCQCEARWC